MIRECEFEALHLIRRVRCDRRQTVGGVRDRSAVHTVARHTARRAHTNAAAAAAGAVRRGADRCGPGCAGDG